MPHGPPHTSPDFYYNGYMQQMHGTYPQNHQEYPMYNRNLGGKFIL